MKVFGAAVALGCVIGCAGAEAQLGVYGRLGYTRSKDDTSFTTRSFLGPGVGVYDDFLHLGPVRAGLDVRGDLLFGDNYRYRDLMVGPRLAFKPPVLPIKPYVQGLIGVGGTVYSGQTAAGITSSYNNKLQYEVLGGIDVTVFPHIDFRAIELGYGQRPKSYGGNAGPTIFTVGTGLVIRL